METTYWQKQTPANPLFPDIEWSKPERRDQAGALAIIGGNKLGFSGVAEAYATAHAAGIGKVKVLLPDALKTVIPAMITEALFVPSTPSGSVSKEAIPEMRALGEWADAVLLIGDAGRNSETAIAYEQFIEQFEGQLTLTRDAIDLVKNNAQLLVERPNTVLVASFAQVQKLFQAVYYPKMLTFSMQLTQLVEAVHKFTITYPVTIMTLHNESIVVAHGGKVTTTKWDNPMAIWRGTVATNAAAYWLWSAGAPLESVTSSLLAQKTPPKG